MIVLLGFLGGVFVLSASLQSRRRPFRTTWLLVITTVVAVSFYSLRVIS